MKCITNLTSLNAVNFCCLWIIILLFMQFLLCARYDGAFYNYRGEWEMLFVLKNVTVCGENQQQFYLTFMVQYIYFPKEYFQRFQNKTV